MLGVGIVSGAAAIVLSLLGGSHLHWIHGGNVTNVDIRIGAGGGLPSDLLGTISVICLLLGSAFFAASSRPPSGSQPGASDINPVATSFLDFLKKLRRSATDFWIGGVCGGLGTYSPVPTWVWRVVFLVLIFCLGTGLLAYLILWVCIPKEKYGPLKPRPDNPPGSQTGVGG